MKACSIILDTMMILVSPKFMQELLYMKKVDFQVIDARKSFKKHAFQGN